MKEQLNLQMCISALLGMGRDVVITKGFWRFIKKQAIIFSLYVAGLLYRLKPELPLRPERYRPSKTSLKDVPGAGAMLLPLMLPKGLRWGRRQAGRPLRQQLGVPGLLLRNLSQGTILGEPY